MTPKIHFKIILLIQECNEHLLNTKFYATFIIERCFKFWQFLNSNVICCTKIKIYI